MSRILTGNQQVFVHSFSQCLMKEMYNIDFDFEMHSQWLPFFGRLSLHYVVDNSTFTVVFAVKCLVS